MVSATTKGEENALLLKQWIEKATDIIEVNRKMIRNLEKKLDLITDLLTDLCGDKHPETIALLKGDDDGDRNK